MMSTLGYVKPKPRDFKGNSEGFQVALRKYYNKGILMLPQVIWDSTAVIDYESGPAYKTVPSDKKLNLPQIRKQLEKEDRRTRIKPEITQEVIDRINLKNKLMSLSLNQVQQMINKCNLANTDNFQWEDSYISKLYNKKIEGYPTIILVKENEVIEFEAEPTYENLNEFIRTTL